MSRDNVTRRISIFVNDKEVENSLKGIGGAIAHVNNKMRLLNTESEDYDEELKKLQETHGQLTSRMSEMRQEIYGTQRAVEGSTSSLSEMRDAFTGMLDNLLSGDIEGASEGFATIKEGIVSATRSAWAFIATPIGATIAVIAGIAIGTKAVFDFNQELEKSNLILRAFGLKNSEIAAVRSGIEAVSETFGKEFEDIASKANSLSKTFGLSMSEATAVIAEGLDKGGAQNEEFLDSLGEYDEFFSKAGYSAQEFVNVLNKGFDVGIYSDKLPDALKEADLSLKEQTKATRDALSNAFGASFTDNILARVATGQTTTKTALEEIAAQAKKTGLTQQQQAQLTADVFKGAGEDAGGALKILEVVSQTSQKELAQTTSATLDLVKANEKLNNAQAKLFEIKGFGDIWTGIKASATDALAGILIWITDIKKDIQPLIDLIGISLANSWESVKTAFVVAFDIIGGTIKLLSNGIKTAVNVIKKILQGDFLGALDVLKNYFITMGVIVENTFIKIKNTILNSLKAIVGNLSPILEGLGLDVDKIQKKLESFKSKEIIQKPNPRGGAGGGGDHVEKANTKATAEELAKQQALRDAARQKEEDARNKAAEKKKAARDKAIAEEKKAEEEKDKELLAAHAQFAKASLDYFIAFNKSKLEADAKLTPKIIDEETKRLDEIRFQQENALADDCLSRIEKAELEIKDKTALKETIAAIDLEYLTAEQNLDLGFQKATTELKNQYELQQKQLKLDQLLADNELELLEAGTKQEAEAIKQQQDYNAQKDRYAKLYADNLITKDKFDRFNAAADLKQKEIQRISNLNSVDEKLKEMGKLADASIAIFGQNKAAASAMAAINGGLAVTEILKTPSVLPEPLASISRGIQIAGAVANTIRSISAINKEEAPSRAKFFYGGATGSNPVLGHDEYGPMTGIVHKNEYVIPEVMTANPRYANTIAWLEQERTSGVPKYVNGGGTSPEAIPTALVAENDDDIKSLILAMIHRLENPIAPNLAIGYPEAEAIDKLNKERDQSTANGIVNK
jgi:hypothetical protein